MKICAVICELNPLHNGHEYIFRKAKEQSGADYLVAIMSGNFVQRAEPAVMDENTRAEVALNCGADMVLELPIVYSVASADKFAGGAIKIVNTLPFVSHLVMGAEDNAQLLERAAEIQAKESDEFKNTLRQLLRDGMSYAKALTHATAEIACPENKNEYLSILNKPNNILAVAYKKALISSKSKVEFLPVPRIGGEISANFKGEYSSASAIRANIGSDVDVSVSMPKFSYDTLARELSSRPVSKEKFDALTLFALRNASLDELAETPDCAEGFEHKIKELAIKTASYDEFLSAVPTSRFTKGRIMRICLQTLLKITKDVQSLDYNFSRLLGIRADARQLLSILPDEVITNKQSERNIPDKLFPVFEAEKRASSLYSLISGRKEDIFYHKLAVID